MAKQVRTSPASLADERASLEARQRELEAQWREFDARVRELDAYAAGQVAAAEGAATAFLHKTENVAVHGATRTDSWGISGLHPLRASAIRFDRGVKERITLAFTSLFGDPDIKAQLAEWKGAYVNFRVVQYGTPLDESYVPDVAMTAELKELILRAITDGTSKGVSGWLPHPKPGAFSLSVTGHLLAEVVVERWEQQHSRIVTGDIVGAFNREVASKLADLPADFEARRQALAALHDAERLAIAQALEPVLNAQAASMPHETYEDKKTLSKWVNAELRLFGLALKCPKTGRPAILVGHPGGQPGIGRFQLEVILDNGRPHRTVNTAALPALELIPGPDREVAPPERGRSR